MYYSFYKPLIIIIALLCSDYITNSDAFTWQDDRCLHMALPVVAFIEMLTNSVASGATTATHAGCVQRGLGRNTPFKARQQKCCGR